MDCKFPLSSPSVCVSVGSGKNGLVFTVCGAPAAEVDVTVGVPLESVVGAAPEAEERGKEVEFVAVESEVVVEEENSESLVARSARTGGIRPRGTLG